MGPLQRFSHMAVRLVGTKAATPAGHRGLAVGAGALCAGVAGASFFMGPGNTPACDGKNKKTIHTMMAEILDRVSVIEGTLGIATEEARVQFDAEHYTDGVNANFTVGSEKEVLDTYGGPTGRFENVETRDIARGKASIISAIEGVCPLVGKVTTALLWSG